jgi:hypothetical protein
MFPLSLRRLMLLAVSFSILTIPATVAALTAAPCHTGCW